MAFNSRDGPQGYQWSAGQGGGGGGRGMGGQSAFGGYEASGGGGGWGSAGGRGGGGSGGGGAFGRGASSYASLLSQVESAVGGFANLVRELNRHVEQIGSRGDSQSLRRRVHEQMAAGKAEILRISQLFKEVQAQHHTLDPVERRAERIREDKLLKDFKQWGAKFQDLQQSEIAKEKRNRIPQPTTSEAALIPGLDGLREYTEEDSRQHQTAAMQAQQRQAVVHLEHEREFNDALILERDQGIREIEQQVLEVNEIFRDLGAIVHEQGYMVDNIEAHIEATASHAEKGVGELVKAETSQRKARKKMCCITVIVTVIVAVVVLIVLLSTKAI